MQENCVWPAIAEIGCHRAATIWSAKIQDIVPQLVGYAEPVQAIVRFIAGTDAGTAKDKCSFYRQREEGTCLRSSQRVVLGNAQARLSSQFEVFRLSAN